MNLLRFARLAPSTLGFAIVVACKASDEPPPDNAPRRQDYARCPAQGIGCGFCCEQESPIADPNGKSREAQWKCDCERCGDVCASSQRCGGDPNEEGNDTCLGCVFQDDKCKEVGRRACADDATCSAYFACLATCPP